VGFVSIPMGLLGGGFQDQLEEEEEAEMEAEASKAGGGDLALNVEEKKEIDEMPVELMEVNDRFTTRQRVAKFLEGSAQNNSASDDPWERRACKFEKAVFLMIFLSAIQATLETVPGLIPKHGPAMYITAVFQFCVVMLFSVEYVLRYYTAPEVPEWKDVGYVSDSACRFAHAMSFFSIIDMLSIAPFYISLCGSTAADKYNGQLRMLRIFRLLTLDKYIPSVSLIGGVVRTAWKQFVLAGYSMVALWLIFATLLWLTECEDHTLVNYLYEDQRYRSVVSALPYTLVHLTGDYPLVDYTIAAKFCLFWSLLFAVGIVAVPAGLMASGFSKQLELFRAQERAKAHSSHSKLGNFLKGWIYRRRMQKLIKAAVAKSHEDKAQLAKNQSEKSWKYVVHQFLERRTKAGRMWAWIMLIMVISNILSVIAESMQTVYFLVGKRIWDSFELMSVVVLQVSIWRTSSRLQ